MAKPRVKASKKFSGTEPRPAKISRKCRACSKWSLVRAGERCQWCGAEYGRPALGLDLPPGADPPNDVKPDWAVNDG